MVQQQSAVAERARSAKEISKRGAGMKKGAINRPLHRACSAQDLPAGGGIRAGSTLQAGIGQGKCRAITVVGLRLTGDRRCGQSKRGSCYHAGNRVIVGVGGNRERHVATGAVVATVEAPTFFQRARSLCQCRPRLGAVGADDIVTEKSHRHYANDGNDGHYDQQLDH